MKELQQKFGKIINQHSNKLVHKNRLIDLLIKEVKKYEERNSGFVPPTKSELTDYIINNDLMPTMTVHGITEIATMFTDYYDSVGWVIGKDKKQMQDWKKAMNNWCKRNWNSQAKAKVNESIKAHLLIQKQLSN